MVNRLPRDIDATFRQLANYVAETSFWRKLVKELKLSNKTKPTFTIEELISFYKRYEKEEPYKTQLGALQSEFPPIASPDEVFERIQQLLTHKIKEKAPDANAFIIEKGIQKTPEDFKKVRKQFANEHYFLVYLTEYYDEVYKGAPNRLPNEANPAGQDPVQENEIAGDNPQENEQPPEEKKGNEEEGNGLFYYVWWKLSIKDYERLRDDHSYPRNIGELKSHFQEIGRKDLLPDGPIREALTGDKREGSVKGEFLGCAGLCSRGTEERREIWFDPLPDLQEGEVIAVGVARAHHWQHQDPNHRRNTGMRLGAVTQEDGPDTASREENIEFDVQRVVWKWDKWNGHFKDGETLVRGRVVQLSEEQKAELGIKRGQVLSEEVAMKLLDVSTFPDIGTDAAQVSLKSLFKSSNYESKMLSDPQGFFSFTKIPLPEYLEARAEVKSDKLVGKHVFPQDIFINLKTPKVENVVIILGESQTKPGQDLIVRPQTDPNKKHKKPKDGNYGAETPVVIKPGSVNAELSFTTPIEKGHKIADPVPKGFYMFFAKKQGSIYVPAMKLPWCSDVTIQKDDQKVFEGKFGKYISIPGKVRWQDLVMTPTISIPEGTPSGTYRLYCVVMNARAKLPSVLEELEKTETVHDLNYITFAVTDMDQKEFEKLDTHFKNGMKDLEKHFNVGKKDGGDRLGLVGNDENNIKETLKQLATVKHKIEMDAPASPVTDMVHKIVDEITSNYFNWWQARDMDKIQKLNTYSRSYLGDTESTQNDPITWDYLLEVIAELLKPAKKKK